MTQVITDDGLRLSYDDQGDGPAVLALAGLTRNRDDFQFLHPHLDRYRLIRLDCRGRGLSEHDPSRGYTIPREAQDVLCLLDHLEIAKISIIGTSRGGLLAMMVAALQPERLSAVVLNDIGPEIPAAGMARIMDYVGLTPEDTSLDAAALRLRAAHAQDFPGVPLARWRAHAAACFAESEYGIALRYDPGLREALLEQSRTSQARPDLWPLFDALADVPLGLVRGQNSDILLPETVAEMRKRRPDMTVAEIADRGHCPFLDEPEAVQVIHQTLDAAR